MFYETTIIYNNRSKNLNQSLYNKGLVNIIHFLLGKSAKNVTFGHLQNIMTNIAKCVNTNKQNIKKITKCFIIKTKKQLYIQETVV